MTPLGVETVARSRMWHSICKGLTGWIADKKLSREFWMFFLAALCFDFGFAMFLFLYNLFLLDIGLNERQLGLVAGAMTLGSMAGTIPVGMLVQRVGLRRILTLGFIAIPVLSALRTVVVGAYARVALAFVAGTFLCIWAVCFSPAAAKLTTKNNRAFAFSLLFSVGIGTGGLGGLVGGYLPGWLQAMIPSLGAADAKRVVLLMCCGVVALGIWPVRRLKLIGTGRTGGVRWRFDPFLWRYLPAAALWSLVAGSFMPFATVYLSRRVHVPLAHIGVIFSASQMAQVIAVLLSPAVFRRCGLVAGIMYTQLATAIALAGLARAHALPVIVALYLSFTAFHWMGGPGIYSLLMNRVEEEGHGIASAANSLVTSLSQAIASATAGAAYVEFGYSKVFLAIACVAALAAVLFWMSLRENGAGRYSLALSATATRRSVTDDNEMTNGMQQWDNYTGE